MHAATIQCNPIDNNCSYSDKACNNLICGLKIIIYCIKMHVAISDELIKRMRLLNCVGEFLKITTNEHNSNSIPINENITNKWENNVNEKELNNNKELIIKN